MKTVSFFVSLRTNICISIYMYFYHYIFIVAERIHDNKNKKALHSLLKLKPTFHFFIKQFIYQQVLTTVGKAKGLALEWGSGEPAIAIATDWLMVPLSGSLSSPSAEAWRTRWADVSVTYKSQKIHISLLLGSANGSLELWPLKDYSTHKQRVHRNNARDKAALL